MLNLHFKPDNAIIESTTNVSESSHQKKILALFQNQNLISRKDIEKALHISQTMLINLIRALTEQGVLVRDGAGKYTLSLEQQGDITRISGKM